MNHQPREFGPAELSDAELKKIVFATDSIPPRSSRYFRVKYRIERFLAFILLLAFLPVMLVLGLLVRLTSRGPAVYRQVRTGEGGRTFTIYKFRSMRHDAEKRSGKIWCVVGDTRITWFGRFLRFFHLDELPQLWNVVRGEMTLVGPRPERPEFVKVLIDQVDHYYRRHAMRPGITGLAQIFLPPDQDLRSVQSKIQYDLLYLYNACFMLDIKIWICTALRLVGVRFGIGPRLVRLDRQIRSYERGTRRALYPSRSTGVSDQRVVVGGIDEAGERRSIGRRSEAASSAGGSSRFGLVSIVSDCSSGLSVGSGEYQREV